MKNLINLTPHDIVVIGDKDTLTIKPSGIARVDCKNVKSGDVNGIPIFKQVFGSVTGLPTQQSVDTFYVVSMIVKSASQNRDDLLTPADLVRDDSGRIIGCKGFAS